MNNKKCMKFSITPAATGMMLNIDSFSQQERFICLASRSCEGDVFVYSYGCMYRHANFLFLSEGPE